LIVIIGYIDRIDNVLFRTMVFVFSLSMPFHIDPWPPSCDWMIRPSLQNKYSDRPFLYEIVYQNRIIWYTFWNIIWMLHVIGHSSSSDNSVWLVLTRLINWIRVSPY